MPLYQHVMVGKRLLDLFAVLRRRRGGRVRQGGRPGQRRAAADRPRRLGQQPDEGPSLRRKAPGPAAGATAAPQVGNGRRVWIPSRVDVHRPARPRGAAAGDRVHLQPGRLRRGRPAVPQRRDPADHRRRSATRSTRSSRRPAADLPDEDLHVLGLPRLPRRADPRRSPPTTPGCCRRSSSASRSSSCAACCKVGLRDRDAGAGHQHAGPHGGASRSSSKWNGETHADITPGEYTQLTGRAGRRGLDVEGHGVVLWQPGMNPARGRRPGLHPHLPAPLELPAVVQHGGQPGRTSSAASAPASCWSMSFAQFQADKAVVGLARQLRKSQDALAGLRRGGDLRPRRLHGVRRAAAPDLRPGEGRRPGPAGPTGARRRSTSLAQLQPRRRDRGAGRQVRRVRRRARPRRCVVRRARGPYVADRRAAGPPAQRWSTSRRRSTRVTRLRLPRRLQRPQPADAPRPRLGAAHRAPTT